MIAAELRSLDIPLLDGNMFRQVNMYWTSDSVIKFVNFLYGTEWKPHTTLSLIFCMDHPMYTMCSFAAYEFSCSGDKKSRMCSNSFSPWKSVMSNHLYWYLELTCFRPDIISYLPLLLNACTYPK